MPTRKKKSRKQRGSRYCGWGQVGQHRGSGSRGGKGRAGGRKHFWIRTIKYGPERYEHRGFKPPSSYKKTQTINIGELENLILKEYGVKGLNEEFIVNLPELGYDKLLGRGKIGVALRVKTDAYTQNALTKIENAGGEIVQ